MKKSMEELVQLAQASDENAIAELYEQTYASVYQSVRAVIKDEDEALDIVQDSYIKGFQSLDKLADPQKYQAWMKTIAANQARDFLRKKRPALFSERIDQDGEEIDLRRQDDCLEHMPEEVIDRQETTRLINDILATLKAEQRLVVVMYYYEEMSVREIAEKLGISENTVKSRLKYARDKIEVEVRKLEKKGTKLYSLAPMPFFTWLLQEAKRQGISIIMDGLEAVATAGTVAAGEATVTGATAVTGETVAGSASAAAGNAVAGGATKALATKIVAGALAVTMTVGAGTVAVSKISREKENKEAHAIYEEFLGRYKTALEMSSSERFADIDRFWSEICEDVQENCPEALQNGDWYLDYTYGEDFADGVPVPDTLYDINMNEMTLMCTKLEEEQVCYAFCDINEDGVDEMFVSMFYRGELQQQYHLNVYAVEDGKLYRGSVDAFSREGDIDTWTMELDREATFDISPCLLYINLGKGYFDEPIEIPEPSLDWQELIGW